MEKKLYRSRTNRTFAGVCGGLGLYLNIDPTLVRVLYVLLSVISAGFPGLLIYIILLFVIPEEPEGFQGYAPPYQYQPPQYPPPPPPAQPEQPPEN